MPHSPAFLSPPAAAAGPGAGVLTDRLLRSWLRCRRRAWLDRHGPLEQRRWNAHRALALQEQQFSFGQFLDHPPGRGEEACRNGSLAVTGLRLRGDGPGRLRLEAHPALLQRIEAPSRWGAHAYRPVLARQGRRVTREHRLLLALWARLLAERQQAPVREGLVLGTEGRALRRERLPLGDALQRQLDDSLRRLAHDLQRAEPPPLVNDRKKCALCGWRDLCDREAVAVGHLSEVSGIGGKRRELLLDLGITRLGELAAADPSSLGEALAVHGEQHREIAASLVAQAQVQAAGQPRRLAAGEALPELGDASGVLLYDIESDPDARDDYLHGLLLLPRDGRGTFPADAASGRYRPLLALQEHGEALLWRRLRTLLGRHGELPVLHYGETEALSLLRLAERHGASKAERLQLAARLVDVHRRLRRHWLLPVNSYGLKAVAGWIGFRWSQKGVDGARCLLWWRQWRQGREATAQGRISRPSGALRLHRILRYNRDDLHATWVVAQWLMEQDADPAAGQKRSQSPLPCRPPPAPTGGDVNPQGRESERATPSPGASAPA